MIIKSSNIFNFKKMYKIKLSKEIDDGCNIEPYDLVCTTYPIVYNLLIVYFFKDSKDFTKKESDRV